MLLNVDIINVALSDISLREQELVSGCYDSLTPRKGAGVAVQVPDNMGEHATVVEAI